jgi:hypothetical protein
MSKEEARYAAQAFAKATTAKNITVHAHPRRPNQFFVAFEINGCGLISDNLSVTFQYIAAYAK